VEFVVNEFWTAYHNEIPTEMKIPSESTIRNLKHLRELQVIDEDDFRRLSWVRNKRDDHIHNYPRKKFLTQNYARVLIADNLQAVKKLVEFFAKDNMESKYTQYLDYSASLGD
jgi:hypothetical protein